jgi:hypothetical protein
MNNNGQKQKAQICRICVILTRKNVTTTNTSVISSRKMRFSHLKCDYHTHEFDLKRMSVIMTFTSVITTRTSAIYACIVIRTCMIKTSILTSVILTRMSIITTPTSVISLWKMRYPHLECDFDTLSVISTHTNMVLTRNKWYYDIHECDYDTHKRDFYAHKCYLYTHFYFNMHDCNFQMHMWHAWV